MREIGKMTVGKHGTDRNKMNERKQGNERSVRNERNVKREKCEE